MEPFDAKADVRVKSAAHDSRRWRVKPRWIAWILLGWLASGIPEATAETSGFDNSAEIATSVYVEEGFWNGAEFIEGKQWITDAQIRIDPGSTPETAVLRIDIGQGPEIVLELAALDGLPLESGEVFGIEDDGVRLNLYEEDENGVVTAIDFDGNFKPGVGSGPPIKLRVRYNAPPPSDPEEEPFIPLSKEEEENAVPGGGSIFFDEPPVEPGPTKPGDVPVDPIAGEEGTTQSEEDAQKYVQEDVAQLLDANNNHDNDYAYDKDPMVTAASALSQSAASDPSPNPAAAAVLPFANPVPATWRVPSKEPEVEPVVWRKSIRVERREWNGFDEMEWDAPIDEFYSASDFEAEEEPEAFEGFQEAKLIAVIERPQQDETTRGDAIRAAPEFAEEPGRDAATPSNTMSAASILPDPPDEPELSLESLLWDWVKASASALADWIDQVNEAWIEAST